MGAACANLAAVQHQADIGIDIDEFVDGGRDRRFRATEAAPFGALTA